MKNELNFRNFVGYFLPAINRTTWYTRFLHQGESWKCVKIKHAILLVQIWQKIAIYVSN